MSFSRSWPLIRSRRQTISPSRRPRLDGNDTAAALELLHRLIQLPSSETQTSRIFYANLDSAAGLLERSSHPAEALPFLTTLANATPWNPSYRLRLAKLQLSARQNVPAATAVLNQIVSCECCFLCRSHRRCDCPPANHRRKAVRQRGAHSARWLCNCAAAGQPAYFAAARSEAAATASAAASPHCSARPWRLRPSDELRLAIFRAEFALGHNTQALAAIKPLLQSAGYYQPSALPTIYAHPDDAESIPLPGILRSSEETHHIWMDVPTLYEKDGR